MNHFMMYGTNKSNRGVFDELSALREDTGILCLDRLEELKVDIIDFADAFNLSYNEGKAMMMKPISKKSSLKR